MAWRLTGSRGPEPSPRCHHNLLGRLEIYEDGYFLRIQDVMKEDFPATCRALGEDVFRGLVNNYLFAYPSKYPNVSDVSINFPEFLKSTPFVTDLPFLPELALLERREIDSFFAADLPPFGTNAFQKISPDHLPKTRFKLHPSVFLLSFDHPVHTIIENVNEDDSVFFKLPDKRKTFVLLYRKSERVRSQELDLPTFTLLSSLQDGKSIAESLAPDLKPEQVQTLFAFWLENEILQSYYF